MLATIQYPLLVCVVGLIAYLWADGGGSRDKAAKIGFALFVLGAFWCVYVSIPHVARL